MCIKKPPQVGAIVAKNSFGRLECVKGNGANARYRAIKYTIGANGEPDIIEETRDGVVRDVSNWFKKWSTDHYAISETAAISLSKQIEALKKESEMSQKSNETVEINTDDLVAAILTIGESMDRTVSILRDIEKKIDSGIKPAVINVKAETIGDAVKIAKKDDEPKTVSDKDVQAFLDTMSALDVVNFKTAYIYAKFVDWCRERNLKPCSNNRLTRKASDAYGLKVINGYFRPSSWKVKAGGDR